MLKKAYKGSGQMISLLGLGCMRFPTRKDGGKEVIDSEAAQNIVDYAYNHGVNYFDTAYMYHDGESESFIGSALKKYPRESYCLTTKYPVWMADTPEAMRRVITEQFEKCQVEYFDFYLMHALNAEKFQKCIKLGVYEYLQELRKQGKIRKIGFSFHDTPQVLEAIVKKYPWDVAQIQLNYLDWEMQDAKGQYQVLEENGIPCIVMEPVRGGTLANPCEKANELFRAARPDKSVASWAIRYAASLPNVMTVLSGMSTMEQVKDNVATLSDFQPLSPKEYEIIAQAVEAYRKKDIVPCTGCRYCMDCPMGVDIPEMFRLYNKYVEEKDGGKWKEKLEKLPKSKKMENCVKCGKCQQNCPQSIHIPERLANIQEVYDKLG